MVKKKVSGLEWLKLSLPVNCFKREYFSNYGKYVMVFTFSRALRLDGVSK